MAYQIGASERISTAVVSAVAEHKQCDAEEVTTPLNDVLDPDALNRIFAPRNDETPRQGGRVEFTFGGCRVVVDDGATVEVDSAHRVHQ